MAVIDHTPKLLLAWAHAGQHNDKREQRSACRALSPVVLRALLAQSCLSPKLTESITRTATGRPYFAGVSGVDFNISHSGPWLAVALMCGGEQSAVGVDIEQPKMRAFGELIAHIGDEAEYHWWAHSADQQAAFYQAWCLREAVLKSQGVGIAKLHSVVHDPVQQTISTPFAPAGCARFYAELPFYLALFHQGAPLPVQAFEWQHGALHAQKMPSAVSLQVQPHFDAL
ncbi:4'-phosphopantetheinyl transferase superfamily protein [Pasteurellaceae bacterium 20609_3]|uniref:4'-phosphopantetheinyl transferase family protein n=1 Tax=Spirabiliibacterium mucosae TaxID=28156 RepID=UPI001AAC513F|nr:4'-phosphopantetheinyl transferase superfamily protein [Spirabiliibacterium mucosae]MBE2897564.1 4'-phosphopantetheinyl transferase superfamily protein [Spirabiliibacterium mucosae]